MSGASYVQSVLAATGLTDPSGVAVDAAGNVFISDSSNNRVLKLDGFDGPALVFASTNVDYTSAAQTVTVTNTGNAALLFPIPLSGHNPSISTRISPSPAAGPGIVP